MTLSYQEDWAISFCNRHCLPSNAWESTAKALSEFEKKESEDMSRVIENYKNQPTVLSESTKNEMVEWLQTIMANKLKIT